MRSRSRSRSMGRRVVVMSLRKLILVRIKEHRERRAARSEEPLSNQPCRIDGVNWF